MVNPKWRGRVEKGKLTLMDQDRFVSYLASLEGQSVDIVVSKHRKCRSDSQNRLYWEMLSIITYNTGNSKDYLHDYYRSKYLSEKKSINGDTFTQIRSTTSLNTEEFTRYLNDIRFHAFDFFNINLPLD